MAIGDHAAGHSAALAEREELADFGGAHHHGFLDGFQQAGHGVLHFIDQLVNDLVLLDLHTVLFGSVGSSLVHARVESKNNRL